MERQTELVGILSQYAEICVDKPTPARIALTAELLNGAPVDRIVSGLKAHFARSKFFPAPCEIIPPEEPADLASLAWSQLMHRLRTHGFYAGPPPDMEPATARALEGLGGWPMLCSTDADQIPWLGRRFGELFQVFERAERSSLGLPDPGLPDLIEASDEESDEESEES